MKKSVILTLKSPRFLYVGIEQPTPDDYDVARRLSFALWDSLPDQVLRQAAAQSKLQSREQVAAQARRMLADPRAKAKMRYFLHKWLNVERGFDISKDQQQFPEFDKSILSDAFVSLDLFLDDVVWSESSDFRQLLLADYIYVNDRLARFYQMEVPPDLRFSKVTVGPERTAGILTHPYLMSGFAYHKASSPIHRGVFLVRGLLGRSLKPPPIAVAPLDEGFDPNMTTRERVAEQTKPERLPDLSPHDQPAWFQPGELRRGGPFSR